MCCCFSNSFIHDKGLSENVYMTPYKVRSLTNCIQELLHLSAYLKVRDAAKNQFVYIS
jgi:hypothetical protein